jgi:Txe/YoeB family toxin of Txe-Axe toxin-antitoxin module
MRKRYTEGDIETLHDEFEKGTHLSEIAGKLGRDPYGILQKMQKLTIDDPESWDEGRVADYHRQYYEEFRDTVLGKVHRYKIRKRTREMIKLMEGVASHGYDVGRIMSGDNTIQIEIAEEGVDMSQAETDFRVHIHKALDAVKIRKVSPFLRLTHVDNTMVIGFDTSGIDFTRKGGLRYFLDAYSTVLRKDAVY